MLDKGDENWEKCIGQFKLALNGIMKPLRLYGQDTYVDSATKEIESLAIQLHHRLGGIDEPFHVNHDRLHH